MEDLCRKGGKFKHLFHASSGLTIEKVFKAFLFVSRLGEKMHFNRNLLKSAGLVFAVSILHVTSDKSLFSSGPGLRTVRYLQITQIGVTWADFRRPWGVLVTVSCAGICGWQFKKIWPMSSSEENASKLWGEKKKATRKVFWQVRGEITPGFFGVYIKLNS